MKIAAMLAFLGAFLVATSAFPSELNLHWPEGPDIHPCDARCLVSKVCELNADGTERLLKFNDALEQNNAVRYCRRKTIRGQLDDCVCRQNCECPGHRQRQACGSDGKTYSSHCHLHRTACLERRHISVVKIGPCESVCTDSPPEIVSHFPTNFEHVIDVSHLLLVPLCANFSQLVKPTRLIKATKTALANYEVRPDLLAFLNAVQHLDALNHSVSYVLPLDMQQQLQCIKPILNDILQLPFLPAVDRSLVLIEAVLTLNHTYQVFSPVPDCCSLLFHPILNGNALRLECISPNAEKVTWYRNGYPISSRWHQTLGDGSLLLKNLLPIDSGLYTCVATSGCAESSLSSFIDIRTSYPEDPVIPPPVLSCRDFNNYTVSGSYLPLKLIDISVVNLTFANFTSPYLQLTNVSAINLTLVNVTIDHLIISESYQHINLTLQNSTLGRLDMINVNAVNASFIEVAVRSGQLINVVLNNATWIDSSLIEVVHANVTAFNISYINVTTAYLVFKNVSLVYHTTVNSVFTNYTMINYTTVNAIHRDSSWIGGEIIDYTAVGQSLIDCREENSLAVNHIEIDGSTVNYRAVNGTHVNLMRLNVTDVSWTAVNVTEVNSFYKDYTVFGRVCSDCTLLNHSYVNSALTDVVYKNTTEHLMRFIDVSAYNPVFLNVTSSSRTEENTIIVNTTLIDCMVSNYTITNGSILNSVYYSVTFDDAIHNDATFTDMIVSLVTFNNAAVTNVTMVDSQFIGVQFLNGSLINLSWIDITAQHLYFGNQTGENFALINSTVVNTIFWNSTLPSVTVVNVMFVLLNVSQSVFDNLVLRNCTVKEALLKESNTSIVQLEDNLFNETFYTNTEVCVKNFESNVGFPHLQNCRGLIKKIKFLEGSGRLVRVDKLPYFSLTQLEQLILKLDDLSTPVISSLP